MANNKNKNDITKVPKKIYVDPVKYERLKTVLDIMNISITDYLDQMITDFLDSLEDAVLSQDKEAFLNIMSKNLDIIQNELEQELNK